VRLRLRHSSGGDSSIGELRRTSIALSACSLQRLARQIIEGWRFITFDKPPAWLRTLSILAVVGYVVALILLEARPNLGPWQFPAIHSWLGRRPSAVCSGVVWGCIPVWLAARLLGCAIANTALLSLRLVTFPVVLTLGMLRRFGAGRRLLPRFLDALSPLMLQTDAMRLFGHLMAQSGTEQVRTLQAARPNQIITELIEQFPNDFLPLVPAWIWPQLVCADITPAARAILFSHSLHSNACGKLVLAALAVGNWFVDPTCDQLLARQLAALPEDRLADVLDAIAVLDCSLFRPSLPHILKCVQRLDDSSALQRFQEALSLTSLQTCEAALARTEIS
jgi:hypothetical protein